MSTTNETVKGGEVEVTTWQYEGGQVLLDASDLTDSAFLILTPGEAVQLSRALVAAAAEALGVAV